MKYTKAEAKVVLFDNGDVITTSGNGGPAWGTICVVNGDNPEAPSLCGSWVGFQSEGAEGPGLM